MTIHIPIEIVKLDQGSFHLFVKGKVNHQECDLILDTGASKTVFALHYLEPILVSPPTLEKEIQSAGITAGIIDSHEGIVNHFSIGNFFIPDFKIVLLDLSSIDQMYRNITDKSIWGLIGSDFLVKYKAKIDYAKKRLTLHIPKKNFLVG